MNTHQTMMTVTASSSSSVADPSSSNTTSPTIENNHQIGGGGVDNSGSGSGSGGESSCKIKEYCNMEQLSNDFERLINNPVLSDVIFHIGRSSPSSLNHHQSYVGHDQAQRRNCERECIHRVYAHKILLVQRSEYFRAMFLNTGFVEASSTALSSSSTSYENDDHDNDSNSDDNVVEQRETTTTTTTTMDKGKQKLRTEQLQKPQQPQKLQQQHVVINIDQFELNEFLKVIRYLYCGRVQFEQSLNTDAMNVLRAADYFQCDELKSYCVEHLQNLISDECALYMLQLANGFCCEELIDTCFGFIAGNTQEVLESEAFTQLDHHTLRLVLESEFLAADEIQVFTALLRYAVMSLYCEIMHLQTSNNNGQELTEQERREDEELIKKLFTRFEASVNRDRSSLNKMARRTSSMGPMASALLNSSSNSNNNSSATISTVNNESEEDRLPNVQIKKFNGGYEAFISNLGRALQSTRHRQRFKEIVNEHVSLIRFPLMTAEQLTNVVEPLDIVPDQYMLEAYRFHCATGVVNKTKTKSSGSSMTGGVVTSGRIGGGGGVGVGSSSISGSGDSVSSPSSSLIATTSPTPSKLQFSIRCQARRGAHKSIEFNGSKILLEQHKGILNQWCEVGPNNKLKKKKEWALAYSATRDGFSATVFHKLCDNRGPSVTVARTTDGFIFGGYNSTSWSSSTCWKPATDTFLFSLVNPYNDGPRKLKVKNNQRAVYNHPSFGPTFGGGGNMSYFDPYDIYIDSSMAHGHTNVGNSYSTFRGGWRSDEAQKSLAGSLNSWTLNECEVFVLQ